MAENSKIEWCDHTVNFAIGCTKVSAECSNCYAESLDKRYKWGGNTHWGHSAPRLVRHEKAQAECLRLNAKAAKSGRVDKVFVNSLSDTFENRDDLIGARLSLYRAIERCHNLTFLLLTKRPQTVTVMVPPEWLEEWPQNCWIGTTTGTQETADERIPELLKIPAKVRFLSVEPQLEEINIQRYFAHSIRCENLPGPGMNGGQPCECRFPSWVIVGGESGPKRRPFNCDWARSLRDQCKAASVPYFFKQVDKVQPIPEDLMIREFPKP